jgi:hypothetical protein
MMEPANTIIEICGGFRAVADMTQRSEVRVRRWTYPKDRGGTGGLIPAECQQLLLTAARARGIGLRPDHFFRPSGESEPETPTPEEDAA